MQKWVHVGPRPLTGHQLVLKSRDLPADVRLWDGFHEESPLCQAETVHCALSLVHLCQQQPQISSTLQIHMRTLKREGQEDTYSEKLHPLDKSYCKGIILIVKPENHITLAFTGIHANSRHLDAKVVSYSTWE